SSFSSESCPKKKAEEVEAEQEENEIHEVSSVSAKTKPSQSIRDESSEGERCSTQGTPHSRASNRNSKRSDSDEIVLCNASCSSRGSKKTKHSHIHLDAQSEMSVGPSSGQEASEQAKTASGFKAQKSVDYDFTPMSSSGVDVSSGFGGSGEETTAGARDCTLTAQKTTEFKSAAQVENVETGTELTEAEEQTKEEKQSSRPSTACSKSKGEEKAQSTREDSLIQEAEENKEDQCSNCENGQDEGRENENEENSKSAENGEQEEAEAVNDELPKENLEEKDDQLITTDDTNVNDIDCGTELKADLEEQLEKESPNDPDPKIDTATSEPTSDDPDKAHEKHEDKSNNKISEKASKAKCKTNSKRLETLNKAAAFSCYSSMGNFSQQSQKGSEDEGEEECEDDNDSMNNHSNGEVQSGESSKPSQMYPDSEEEEEDKASSCTDPLGDEDQADAEGADPKKVEHTDEVQASKKKEDSDEIDQDDLD
ncbi:hypothetical protein FQA23_0005000, partial [Aptenodytes patagonicus]